MKTFPIWEPKEGTADPEILQTFIRHQAALKRLVEEAREFVQQRTVISSPANRNIVYTLERAFEVIIAHEKRHFNQASEVMDAILRTNTNMRSDLITVIRRDVKVPDEEVELISAGFKERRFKRNDVLLHSGEVAHEIFFRTERFAAPVLY